MFNTLTAAMEIVLDLLPLQLTTTTDAERGDSDHMLEYKTLSIPLTDQTNIVYYLEIYLNALLPPREDKKNNRERFKNKSLSIYTNVPKQANDYKSARKQYRKTEILQRCFMGIQ